MFSKRCFSINWVFLNFTQLLCIFVYSAIQPLIALTKVATLVRSLGSVTSGLTESNSWRAVFPVSIKLPELLVDEREGDFVAATGP